MAIRAIALHTSKSLSHPDDKDDPTIWEIGAVDSRVLGMLQDKAARIEVDPTQLDAETGVSMSQNEVAFMVAQFGLKGWVNFKDEKGDVQFQTEQKVLGNRKYDVVKSDLLASIPFDVIQWLSTQVEKLNTMKPDEAKQ